VFVIFWDDCHINRFISAIQIKARWCPASAGPGTTINAEPAKLAENTWPRRHEVKAR